MKLTLNNEKGFTLIEIMVVVTIIGILAAVLFTNFDDARKQARDKSRMTSLKEMQLSIELYKAQYGNYPSQGCGTPGTSFAGASPAASGYANCSTYVTGLVPDFISVLPTDPKFNTIAGRGFFYMTDATGSGYKLMANDVAESILVTSYGDDFARCPGAASPGCTGAVPATTYAIYGGSGANW